MEYHLCKKSFTADRALLDTVSEMPVDVDLTLPDYCPDIERILKCSLIPKIYMSNLSGDRLNVEGGACVRILYLDGDKRRVRSFEYTSPFSESFQLKESPDEYALYTDTKPEYINCRAMSPRKLSLHGAFSLYAKVVVKKDVEYFCHEDDDGLQTRREVLSATELCGLGRDTFTLTEDIPMNGRPEVKSFVAHRLNVRITELKAVGGKLMLSAEGRLELSYLSEPDGDIEALNYAFPISRIVDCPGAEDGCILDPKLDVMTYDLSLSDDALDGSNVLMLDMKLCFNVICRRDKEIGLITDVFATDRDTQQKSEPFSCHSMTRRLSFTDNSKAAIALDGESVSKVIDLHSERISVSAAISGGSPLLSSRMTVSLIYMNSEGEIKCADRDVDLSYNPSVDDCDSVDSVSASVDSLSYRIADDHTIEIRSEVCYRMTVSLNVTRAVVTSVTAPDEADESADSALILCYAEKGEDVWDIAKRYRSRPADITAENDLDGSILPEDKMLLITV